MDMKECSNMKVIILDYRDGSVRIISSENINFHLLEEEHNNDFESYLIEEENYHSSDCEYMVSDNLEITFN